MKVRSLIVIKEITIIIIISAGFLFSAEQNHYLAAIILPIIAIAVVYFDKSFKQKVFSYIGLLLIFFGAIPIYFFGFFKLGWVFMGMGIVTLMWKLALDVVWSENGRS